ncbi:MAG: response regulator [Deltaproteobacteria bacterium]|nr:response regulator [Deltaproteobacteria bacterium]
MLIVEDEQVMRGVMVAALSDCGFGPLGVADLGGAREALAREVPTLVVLDLSLEGEFGAELLAELALRPDGPCVLVCSAFPLADVVAARFGVELLRKPFDLDDLATAAERAIAAGRRPSMPTKTR